MKSNNDIIKTLVSTYVTDLHQYLVKYKDQIILSTKLQTPDVTCYTDYITTKLRHRYRIPELLEGVINLKHSDETKLYLKFTNICCYLADLSLKQHPEVWVDDTRSNVLLATTTSALAALILLTHYYGISMYNSETLKTFTPIISQLATLPDNELKDALVMSLRNAGNLVFSILDHDGANLAIN